MLIMPFDPMVIDPMLLTRISAEFREMPGLRLTVPQACRLWALDEPTCQAAIAALVATGVLRRTTDGAFVRASE